MVIKPFTTIWIFIKSFYSVYFSRKDPYAALDDLQRQVEAYKRKTTRSKLMELRSEFRFWERKVERSEKRTKELLRHVIVLSKNHLYRLLAEYVEYYNFDRTHYSLEKDTPMKRPILHRAIEDYTVIDLPRLGGLHHKYVWKQAA